MSNAWRINHLGFKIETLHRHFSRLFLRLKPWKSPVSRLTYCGRSWCCSHQKLGCIKPKEFECTEAGRLSAISEPDLGWEKLKGIETGMVFYLEFVLFLCWTVGGSSSFQPGWWFFVLVVEAQGRKLCYLMYIRENSQTMRIRRGPTRHLIHLISRYLFYSKRHHVPPVLVMHCFYTLPPGCTVYFFLQGCRSVTHVSLVALVQAFRFEDQLAITSFLLAEKAGLWFLKGPLLLQKCRGFQLQALPGDVLARKTQGEDAFYIHMGVSKNRGVSPKMHGKNNGKPY